MAMKDDAKSLSFVEDTAVAPERLRDYIERFLAIVQRHGTTAGVYAHASVGCLHVRPVVNLKTEAGVRRFEAIANDVADLVLEFGGALSGEHGDGLVRSPFMEKMFGPVLYEAFRDDQADLRSARHLQPRQDRRCAAADREPALRAGVRRRRAPDTYFDYAEYGGMAGAVEMCSGLGACRKTLDGTMCPSYMATRDEQHSTRGRANVLRLAMAGRLGEAGLGDPASTRRSISASSAGRARPNARSASTWRASRASSSPTTGSATARRSHARALGNARRAGATGAAASRRCRTGSSNSGLGRRLDERLLGIDRRRTLPELRSDRTLASAARARAADRRTARDVAAVQRHLHQLLRPRDRPRRARRARAPPGCGPALAPQRLLRTAADLEGAARRARATWPRATPTALYADAAAGRPIVFCEPSCLSAVREDAPALLRGEARRKAQVVAAASVLFEEFCGLDATAPARSRARRRILLHGHCHQKSMGLRGAREGAARRAFPASTVVDLDAGCCGMAGSFGYARDHYDVSRAIGERRLFPAVRSKRRGHRGRRGRHLLPASDLATSPARRPCTRPCCLRLD